MKLPRLLFVGFLIVALQLCSIGSNRIEPVTMPDGSLQEFSYRLDDSVIPIDYSIFIRPYFENENQTKQNEFEGYVIIRVQVLQENVSNITLHHHQQLRIERRYIEPVLSTNDQISITNYVYYGELMQERLLLDKPLVQHALYDVTLDFTGFLRENLQGLHSMSYPSNNTKK